MEYRLVNITLVNALRMFVHRLADGRFAVYRFSLLLLRIFAFQIAE